MSIEANITCQLKCVTQEKLIKRAKPHWKWFDKTEMNSQKGQSRN